MADFDLDKYFAARTAGILQGDEKVIDSFNANLTPKQQEVDQATAEKVSALHALHESRVRNEKNSYVGKLGLDPDSHFGSVANEFASAHSGLSRMVGDIVSGPMDLYSAGQEAMVSDEAKQAYARLKRYEATPDDMTLLDQVNKGPGIHAPDAKGLTNRERLESAERTRQRADKVDKFFDISSIVDTTKRDRLSRDLTKDSKTGLDAVGQGWDKLKSGQITDGAGDMVSGLASLGSNAASAAVDNPGAIGEYVVENIPQIAVGGEARPLLSASNVGYAAEYDRKGVQQYQDTHDGALPSEAERTRIQAYAASLAAAEQLGDMAQLKAFLPKGAADDVARAGLKQALFGTAKETAHGLGTEAATEGYQTFAEGQASGKPASAQDIYESAVIGGLVGGHMSGAGGAAHAAAELAHAANQKAEDTQAQNQAQDQAMVAAVEAGDISAYTKPGTKDYNPVGAVKALMQHAEREEATPEVKERNLDQAHEVVATLQAKYDDSKKLYEDTAPESLEKRRNELTELKTQFADMDPASPEAERLQARIEAREEDLAEDAKIKPEQREKEGRALAQMEQQLTQSREMLTRLQETSAPNTETLEDHINQADAEVDPADTEQVAKSQEAANKIITLAMNNPKAITPEVAGRLAANTSNSLNAEQRTYLRTYSKQAALENSLKTMGDVHAEVVNGKDGSRGIAQYRTGVLDAVRAGNEAKAKTVMQDMTRFAGTRIRKAHVAEQAFHEVLKTRKPKQFLMTTEGKWVPADRKYTSAEIQANGGMTIHTGSGEFVNKLKLESEAVRNAGQQMRAAINMKFGTAPAAVQTAPAEVPAEVAPVETEVEPEAQESEKAPEAPAPVESTETPEVSEPVAENEVQAEPVTEAESTKEDGRLVVFSTEHTPIVEGYQGKNLVAEFAQQKGDSEHFKTVKPLVAVKDFVSKVLSNQVDLQDYYGKGEFTEEQHGLLNKFLKRATEWAPVITGNIKVREGTRAKFNYQDVSQFLLVNGDFEENVKTAMAFAGFSWVAENAGQLRNDDRAINDLLNRDEDTEVSKDERDALQYVGSRERAVINALGQRVVQALGLSMEDTAPTNLQGNLESTLGAHVLKMLTDLKIVERNKVSDRLMNPENYKDPAITQDLHQGHPMIRLARMANDEKQVTNEVNDIVKSNQGTQGVLGQLFSTETNMTEPSYEPVKLTQQTTKNTTQAIPKKLRNILNKEGEKAHVLKQDMLDIWGKLSTSALEQIAGVVSTERKIQKANQVSTKAKNDSLKREIELFNSFVDVLRNRKDTDGVEAPFYLARNVWRQQRVGLVGDINPQTSKIHRHMIAMDGWKTEIQMNDQAALDNFMLGIGESLGVKTDATRNALTLPKIEAALTKPEIQNAVDALRAVLRDEDLTPEMERQITAGVSEGGENFYSLDGLAALAAYEEAKANGKESFETTLFREVDGKTNGPMLTMLQAGATASAKSLFDGFITMGGFYRTQDKVKSYSEYAEKGGLDMYQTMMASVHQHLRQRMVESPRLAQSVQAIEFFTGQLYDSATNKVTKYGRNLVKTPLTAMVFGSGIGGTIDSMAEEFVQKIYDKIEDLANSDKPEAVVQQELSALIKHTNWMLYRAPKLNPRMTIDDALNMTFSSLQKDQIKSGYKFAIGKSVKPMMEAKYGKFLSTRRSMNQAAQLSFELYNAAYKHLKEKTINELMESGELPYRIRANGSKLALTDLTKAQDQAIRDKLKALEPVLHTPLSKMSDELDAGIFLSKVARKLSEEPAYQSEVEFATPLYDADGKGKTKRLSPSAYTREGTNPGVAAVIMAIHSSDSAISALAYEKLAALNVHDAHGLGLKDVLAGAKNLNQNTYNVMLDYSVGSEIYDTLSRVLSGFSQMQGELEGIKLDSEGLTRIMQDLLKNTPEAARESLTGADAMQMLVQDLKAQVAEADRVKFESMAQMAVVDQYSLEGGTYEVTDADRAKAEQLRNGVIDTAGKAEIDAAGALGDLLDPLLKAAAVKLDDEQQDLHESRTTKNEPGAQSVVAAPATLTLPEFDAALADKQVTGELRDNLVAVRDTLMKQPDQGLNVTAYKVLKPRDAAAVIDRLSNQYTSDQKTVWGELGQSSIQHDQTLVSMFEQNPDLKAKDLIRNLAYVIKNGNSSLKDFHLKLLNAVAKSVSPDMPIHYVTEATAPNGVDPKHVTRARGWYTADSRGEALYIRSTDYKESGVTPELMMHELLHAAVAQTIENVKDGKGSPAAKVLVQDLEGLRQKAEDFIKKQGLEDKFGEAVANVHELVSWGLTNSEFQKEVMEQVRFDRASESKQTKNDLVSLMKKFIKSLTDYFFAGSDKSKAVQARTGMGVLISHASGLFAEANNTRTQARKATTLAQMGPDPATRIVDLTTDQLYDMLAQDGNNVADPAFSEHLRDVLKTVTSKVYGDGGLFKVEAERNRALTTQDVYLKAMTTGQMPFVSKALTAGFAKTEQEALVLEQAEASIRAALEDNTVTTTESYKSLVRLYREAEAKLTPEAFHAGDWSQATPTEKAAAEAKHAFLFKHQRTGGRADFLSQFAALAIADQQVSQALNFNTGMRTAAVKQGMPSPLMWMLKVFNGLMSFIESRFLGTLPGEVAHERAMKLAQNLVDIEARRKTKLVSRDLTMGAVVEDAITDLADKAKERVSAFGQSKLFQDSKNGVVKAGGSVMSVLADSRLDLMMEGFQRLRDKTLGGQQGWFAAMIDEVRNASPAVFKQLLLATKAMEGDRKDLITETSKFVLESFKNGKTLSKELKAAVTQTLLRTDLQSLLDHYSMNQMAELVGDSAKRVKAITQFEKQLTGRNRDYYMTAAKQAAYMRVTGIATGDHVVMNAQAIAHLYGTHRAGTVTEAEAKAVMDTLDPLISLYALHYASHKARLATYQLMLEENAREDQGNGVEFVLKAHRRLQQDARERLFSGSEVLMMKGYTPEIYNPYTEVLAATEDEGKQLLAQGYKKVADLEKDPNDPDSEAKALYSIRDRGLRQRVTGIMSFTGKRSRGTKAHGQLVTGDGTEHHRNAKIHSMIARNKAVAIEKMFMPNPDFDPSKVKLDHSPLVPIFNGQGDVVNYRYMMNEQTKDDLLERTNDFDQILGTFAGSSYDKENSKTQNETTVKALYQQYKAEYASRPESYIKFGPDSNDPEIRETWRLLPEDTRRAIQREWGDDNMMVRTDLLRMTFGYRKYSLSEPFEKTDEQRSAVEKIFVNSLESVFGIKAAANVRKVEDVVQEIMKVTKDSLVVKSFDTLIGNITSNLTLLSWAGVPMTEVVRHHTVALKGALTYRRDNKELFRLKQQLETGYIQGNTQAIEQRIIQLEDAIARNPVKELIDAGLMPTIVEDMAIDDDPYSYKSRFVRKTEKWTSNMPKALVTAGKWTFMTHDTPLYQFLSQTTQLSDFVARYTLYQHTTTRRKNPMSKQEALLFASDAFVNYDVPTHKSVQYLNDMGLLMFTKYYLRIQKVISHLFQENPGRAIGMMLFTKFFSSVPTLVDSMALHQIGNPFHASVLNFFGAVDEMATLKMAGTLLPGE